MWFKNLQVYRFTKPFSLSAEQLSEKLAENVFTPCGGQDMSRYGWVPPLVKHGVDFVHAANGHIMICAKRQEKILPAAVVNEFVEQQALELEAKESRQVRRKERQSLKEEAVFSLLPKAFTKSSLQYAYISPKEGLLIINAASSNRAEELMTCLRDTLGSLPVIPVIAKNTPQVTMTQWIESGNLPPQFALGLECELRDTRDESGVVRCKNQDLLSDEIKAHLKAGMYVSKIELCWEGGVSCLVDDRLAIKRLRFDDMVQEKALESDAQDAAEQFDVEFVIMTLTLSTFMASLLGIFGGEDLSQLEQDVIEDGAVEQGSKGTVDVDSPEKEGLAVA